jgi:hypothetical protein
MQSRILRYGVAGALAMALFSGPALAQGNSQGHGKGKGHDKQEQDDDNGGRKHGFGKHDREIIAGYYSNRGSNLPPGLAKRGGDLPPGLEKHLERDGTLPPGLQKRIEPFPPELERQLPPLPADYQRAVIGAHIVILNRHTNVIVDIVKDVVR